MAQFRFAPLAGLRSANLMHEFSAGITLLTISLPLNIGYAQIAGLPTSAGLLALVIPTIVFALCASSRVVVASPDAAGSALVFSSLVGLSIGQESLLVAAGAQAVICGVALIVAGVLKLGFLANFLSKPIMMGFVAGLALEILLSQLFKLSGIPKGEAEGFGQEALHLLTHVTALNPATLFVGVGSLIVLLAGRKLSTRFPWALVVLVLATLAVVWFDLPHRGVTVLGTVDGVTPSFGVPEVSWDMWVSLVPSGVALAFVVLADTLMLSSSYAERQGVPHVRDQDLFALGLSNVAAGCGGSFVQGASASRTAATFDVGARTQLPSLILAAGALAVMGFGLGLLENIPLAAIGAVIAVAVWGLLELKEFQLLWRLSRTECAIAVACILGVLVLGPLQGLLVAFILAAINLIRRVANTPAEVLVGPEDPMMSLLSASAPFRASTAPGVQVFRFTGPLFFANAERFMEQVKAAVGSDGEPVEFLVIDAEGIAELDVTGAQALESAAAWLREQGVSLAFSRVREDIRKRLDHFGLLAGVPVFLTNRAAVAALRTDAGGDAFA